MALFTDGPIITIEDLRGYESSILAVAKSEGIDLTRKIDLAHREIGADIFEYLTERTASETGPSRVGLNQVVVSDLLIQWVTLHALELVFRDCYHSQLNDRYRMKWQEYERQSRRATSRFFQAGPGIVELPVAKASVPVVKESPGVMANGTYEIRVAWLNSRGQTGAASNAVLFTSTDGSVPAVTAGPAPENGVSWHVYAGKPGERLERQNSVPLAATESWTAPSTGFVRGAPMEDGQRPDYFLRRIHVI